MAFLTMVSKANLTRFLTLLAIFLVGIQAQGASSWDKPAADLASRVAEILGPSQAQLTVINRSTVSSNDVPLIRRLLEQELRFHGVQIAGAESANQIRITLSESDRERLWVAEIIEGSQTRYVMIRFDRNAAATTVHESGVILTRKTIWSSVSSTETTASPVLAALETPSALVLLEREALVILARTASGWQEEKRVGLGSRSGQSRDPRGLLVPAADGFTAYAIGTMCDGKFASVNGTQAGDWTVQCHESDDPWPVNANNLGSDPARLRAFFNPARNFYTGILIPSLNADLQPFFSIAVLPGPRLIFGGIDGKIQMLDGNSLKPVTGARDWGSDFAAIHTGCGSDTQILATSSGEAENDSVRAYELFAQEAVAATAPMDLGGTVTALWTAPDGASVLAVLRKSSIEYEVDRVAALCP
jgi:hypothetical protein